MCVDSRSADWANWATEKSGCLPLASRKGRVLNLCPHGSSNEQFLGFPSIGLQRVGIHDKGRANNGEEIPRFEPQIEDSMRGGNDLSSLPNNSEDEYAIDDFEKLIANFQHPIDATGTHHAKK